MDRPTRRLVTALGAAAAVGLLAAATLAGLELGRGTPSGAGQPASHGAAGTTQLVAASSPAATAGATLTVEATGQVAGTPDTVTVQLGITASGATAAAALDQANREMGTLESVFLRYVAHDQLQTSNLNLDPSYDSSGAITGYSADEELTVTMHDVGLAGQLIDTASHAVGNFGHVDSISFSISNTSHLLAAARAQAMQNAHLEASEIAAGAGVTLGPVKSVTDQEQPSLPPPYFNGADASAAGHVAVPLQAGSQQLSVQLQVVYVLGK